MRVILIFLLILFINGCSKPKAVLICGDHVCINKDEAQQFLEINKKKIAKKVSRKVNDKKVFNRDIKKETIIDNKKSQEIFNICLYIEKDCSIEEISKYLLKKGSDKDFPDITLRN